MLILYSHGSASRNDWVYVNGKLIGKSIHAYTGCNTSFITLIIAKDDTVSFTTPGFEANHFIPFK